MADPFSVGAGILGVISLTIKISEVVFKSGLAWKDAPKDVRTFVVELQSLQTTLSDMQTKLISSSSFEEAFDTNGSALLSHLRANDTSKDTIKEAFENCQAQLTELLHSLKANEADQRFGWDRLKSAFLSRSTHDVISQLSRQCAILDKLVLIDMAALTAHTHLDIEGLRKELQDWHMTEANDKVLQWLSQLSFEEKHQDVLSKLHPGTGKWLLDSDTFKSWRNGQFDTPPNLWCPGTPGAGKTVLAANVIHHLQQVFHHDNVAVLFVYCDYKDQRNQTDRNLFASLAKQAVLQQGSLFAEAEALYCQCKRGEIPPSSQQCLDLLMSSMKHFRRTFIVIDAVDEHLTHQDDVFNTEIPLVCELDTIQQRIPEYCTMFLTSREIDLVPKQLHNYTRLDIRAHDEDIESYIHMQIHEENFRFANEIRKNIDLAREVVEKLVEKAQGMFLLPRLHLDRLRNQTTVGKLRKALNDLPSKIDDTYEDAMTRIYHQPEEHCQLALRVLSWVSKAQRPLRLQELQHAVSVAVADDDIEDESLELPDLMVTACAGLVAIDVESGVFRLVHFTVEEFFRKRGKKWFPGADKLVAEICLTYLLLTAFQPGFPGRPSDRLQKYPLLRYASEHWTYHASLALQFQSVKNLIQKFLSDEQKCAASYEAISSLCDEFWCTSQGLERLPGLHLIVERQSLEIGKFWLLSGADINVEDSMGNTALLKSVFKSDVSMVRLLVDSGADVDHKNSYTPLVHAAARAHADIIELLLDAGADPTMKGYGGATVLHLISSTRPRKYGVVEDGQEERVIDLFLEKGRVDINACDDKGDTPIMHALGSFKGETPRILLQRGANIHIRNAQGQTALMKAARGQEDMFINMLLELGADVNAADRDGKTALMVAAQECEVAIIEMLLRSGADVNAADKCGRTSLLIAAQQCEVAIIEMLLRSGAYVNAADHIGMTASMHAVEAWRKEPIYITSAESKSHATIRVLLKAGAEINALDKSGMTALMIASQFSYCLQNVELFLQQKADVNISDRSGRTALTIASQSPNGWRTVMLLLRFGANVNAIDEKRESALIKAVHTYCKVWAEDYNVKWDYSIDFQMWCRMQVVFGKGDNTVPAGLRRRFGTTIRILLYYDVNEDDRKQALNLMLALPNSDQTLVQMLTGRPDIRWNGEDMEFEDKEFEKEDYEEAELKWIADEWFWNEEYDYDGVYYSSPIYGEFEEEDSEEAYLK